MARDLSDDYFQQLNRTLKDHQRALPSLLIDLDTLDKNIAEFKRHGSADKHFRIVVKSLPSPELIRYIMRQMKTNRIMVFHQPFLSDLTKTLDNKADVLLGKPMPIKTASYYYHNLPEIEHQFNPYLQIQWLVDTQTRVLQYIHLAKTLGQKLRLNLEIDVGLHRGGFQNLDDLREALTLINDQQDYVTFSGFMGYDPHIVKLPKVIRSQEKALKMSNQIYSDCKKLVQESFPELWNEQLTFNGAGSPTINLHHTPNSPLNDIAAGSCFVKPTSFDIPTLNHYQPACFIATPVLKKSQGTLLPGIERLKPLLGLINARNAQSFFIYGGYWKADYTYPRGLQQNQLFGASTNQTLINAPITAELEVDDFVFLRPHQSEFVFLQFGKLLIIRAHQIVDHWSLLNND